MLTRRSGAETWELIRAGLDAIGNDRIHRSGYLARKALGLLVLCPRERWPELTERLQGLRPEMPAIAAAVGEAVTEGDARTVIRRADAQRRRVARSAIRALARRRVVTLGNSSLVARALVYARPELAEVIVHGSDDEGHWLLNDLVTAGVVAVAAPSPSPPAEIAVLGGEAVFEDGAWVGPAGSAALVERMPTLLLVDRWKRVRGPAPATWPGADRCEIVRGGNVQVPG